MTRGGKGKENRGLNPSIGERKREEGTGMQRQKRELGKIRGGNGEFRAKQRDKM